MSNLNHSVNNSHGFNTDDECYRVCTMQHQNVNEYMAPNFEIFCVKNNIRTDQAVDTNVYLLSLLDNDINYKFKITTYLMTRNYFLFSLTNRPYQYHVVKVPPR